MQLCPSGGATAHTEQSEWVEVDKALSSITYTPDTVTVSWNPTILTLTLTFEQQVKPSFDDVITAGRDSEPASKRFSWQ